jgi:uncharacterized protein (DUF488 family)
MAVAKKARKPATKQKIYTFGYGNRKNLEPLLAYCEEKGIDLLIDVRKSPRGWSTIWSKPYLEKHLPSHGVEYISLDALGNTSGKQDWVPVDEFEAQKALKQVVQLCNSQNVVLMCSELDPDRCHRVMVAERLSKLTGLPVENLA